MIYKEFGKTGIKMSKLGFGAMRLPTITINDKSVLDYEKSTEIIRKAIELGVNYFDSAPYYCDGESEYALGKAIKGYRDKIYISTKNPIENSSGDDWRKRLENSLKKLDIDYIDFYHMWGISLDTFRNKINVPKGPMETALKAKDEGLIKHISFSFHDEPNNMREIIDSGYFESVLMQYNLLDRSNEENIKYADEKGLGVVIMGPVGGGRLGAPSEVLKKVLKKDFASTAEMALRFVLANEGVNIALSGMSTVEMVEENAKVASIEGKLTTEELNTINKMMEENKKLSDLYCTGCKYCMPCPQGINIPYLFTLMNYYKVYGLIDFAKSAYEKTKIPLDKRNNYEKENGLDASHCIECGACEAKCPQHIKIIKQLKETDRALG